MSFALEIEPCPAVVLNAAMAHFGVYWRMPAAPKRADETS
jgi:hypothetical protein